MIMEMPQYADRLLGFLRIVFNLGVQDYELLTRCSRDDITKHPLTERGLTAAERKMLRILEDRAMIEYSEKTAKWELTVLGNLVIDTVAIVERNPKAPLPIRRGQVIAFPERKSLRK